MKEQIQFYQPEGQELLDGLRLYLEYDEYLEAGKPRIFHGLLGESVICREEETKTSFEHGGITLSNIAIYFPEQDKPSRADCRREFRRYKWRYSEILVAGKTEDVLRRRVSYQPRHFLGRDSKPKHRPGCRLSHRDFYSRGRHNPGWILDRYLKGHFDMEVANCNELDATQTEWDSLYDGIERVPTKTYKAKKLYVPFAEGSKAKRMTVKPVMKTECPRTKKEQDFQRGIIKERIRRERRLRRVLQDSLVR